MAEDTDDDASPGPQIAARRRLHIGSLITGEHDAEPSGLIARLSDLLLSYRPAGEEHLRRPPRRWPSGRSGRLGGHVLFFEELRSSYPEPFGAADRQRFEEPSLIGLLFSTT